MNRRQRNICEQLKNELLELKSKLYLVSVDLSDVRFDATLQMRSDAFTAYCNIYFDTSYLHPNFRRPNKFICRFTHGYAYYEYEIPFNKILNVDFDEIIKYVISIARVKYPTTISENNLTLRRMGID